MLWFASVCKPDCIYCSCAKGPQHPHDGCPVHDARRGRWPWRALAKMTREERADYVKNRPEDLKKMPKALPSPLPGQWKYCYDCWHYGPMENCPICVNIEAAAWAPPCPLHPEGH